MEPATWLIGDALVRVQIDFVDAPLRGAGLLSSPPRSVLKLDIFVVDRQSQATPFALAFAAPRAVILKCQGPFFSACVTQNVRIDLALPSFIGELYRPMIDDRLTQQLESCAVTGADYFERIVAVGAIAECCRADVESGDRYNAHAFHHGKAGSVGQRKLPFGKR